MTITIITNDQTYYYHNVERAWTENQHKNGKWLMLTGTNLIETFFDEHMKKHQIDLRDLIEKQEYLPIELNEEDIIEIRN